MADPHGEKTKEGESKTFSSFSNAYKVVKNQIKRWPFIRRFKFAREKTEGGIPIMQELQQR